MFVNLIQGSTDQYIIQWPSFRYQLPLMGGIFSDLNIWNMKQVRSRGGGGGGGRSGGGGGGCSSLPEILKWKENYFVNKYIIKTNLCTTISLEFWRSKRFFHNLVTHKLHRHSSNSLLICQLLANSEDSFQV